MNRQTYDLTAREMIWWRTKGHIPAKLLTGGMRVGTAVALTAHFPPTLRGRLPPLQLFLLRRVSELFEWCVCVQPLNRAYSRHGWMSAQIGCHVSPVPLYGSFMCGIIHKNVCLASIFTLASSYLNASFTVQSAMPLCASLLLLDWWKLISGMKSGFLYANNWTILFLEFLKGGSLVGEGNT